MQAAILGNNDQTIKYAKSGKINKKHGKRLLFFTAAFGSVDALKALQDCGLRFDEVDSEGNTLLHIAAAYNKKAVVDYLMQSGLKTDSLNIHEHTPITKAAVAGNIETMKTLRAQGVSWQTDDFMVDTLTAACVSGTKDSIKFVVENGFPKDSAAYETAIYNMWNNSTNAFGVTRDARVKAMLETGMLSAFSKGEAQDLLESACTQDEKSALLLLDAGVTPNDECLLAACEERYHQLIDRLIDQGMDVNKKGLPLENAICAGDLKTIELLIKNGADVNYSYKNGDTPLLKSIDRPSSGVIRYLVEAGANIDVKDKKGRTPFEKAKEDSIYFEKDRTVLKLLKLEH